MASRTAVNEGTSISWGADVTVSGQVYQKCSYKEILIYPLFIADNPDEKTLIPSLPNQYRRGLNRLATFLLPLICEGLRSFILFGIPLNPISKSRLDTATDDPTGPVVEAIRLICKNFPKMYIVRDSNICTLCWWLSKIPGNQVTWLLPFHFCITRMLKLQTNYQIFLFLNLLPNLCIP